MHQPAVSAAWLYQHLNDPQTIIIDCRFSLTDSHQGCQQYQKSHIPKAYYLDLNADLSSPVAKHGGRHPLPDVQKLAQKLTAIGVNSETTVIAYDDARLAFAARLWWLLRYLGHDRVAVLDGGFSNWVASNYPVTDAIPQPQSGGNFIPQVQANKVVDITAVKARKDLPEVVLVDARDRDRYSGKHEPIDPIAGHIPGAVNYPWQDVTTNEGFLHPQAAQRQRWQLPASSEIIVYCGSGVTACVNLLSLEIAGIDTGKLYAGSWSDWCSYEV